MIIFYNMKEVAVLVEVIQEALVEALEIQVTVVLVIHMVVVVTVVKALEVLVDKVSVVDTGVATEVAMAHHMDMGFSEIA